ncbi:MAG: putative sugar O-methyltransferase [Dermatophilaceae bacterium]
MTTTPAGVPPHQHQTDPARWVAQVDRTLAELGGCDPLYRPTDFWGPGLDQLLGDLRARGLEKFKQWPSASWWFYPLYGGGFGRARVDHLWPSVLQVHPKASRTWFHQALNGTVEAMRDFDVVRLAWDQERWPFDLEGFGESVVGQPWQRFPLSPVADVRFGRPYLNYLLCLAALSRHVEEPPSSFLEIGGGFGVLGEIVLARDPAARYVNVDIPPLMSVAGYYLATLFGEERVAPYESLPPSGPIEVASSASLPSWRLPDLRGSYDVFVNSYSFQEMEPHVVANYVERVAAIGPQYVLSLNSREGKPRKADGHEVGVVDPVTSGHIVSMFEDAGYELVGSYNRPLIISLGEAVVLRRTRGAA